jgi:hypothetical protein
MIDDKVEIKIANIESQKRKAKKLSDMLKKAVPLLWKANLKYNEEKHWLEIELRDFKYFLLDPKGISSGFNVVPFYEHDTLRKIFLCLEHEEEKEFIDYYMAKKFARRVQERYSGQYSIEIIPKK